MRDRRWRLSGEIRVESPSWTSCVSTLAKHEIQTSFTVRCTSARCRKIGKPTWQ